jgi:hypothetical protein
MLVALHRKAVVNKEVAVVAAAVAVEREDGEGRGVEGMSKRAV